MFVPTPGAVSPASANRMLSAFNATPGGTASSLGLPHDICFRDSNPIRLHLIKFVCFLHLPTQVFSDEFEQDGRQFEDGADPRWTAIDKNDCEYPSREGDLLQKHFAYHPSSNFPSSRHKRGAALLSA